MVNLGELMVGDYGIDGHSAVSMGTLQFLCTIISKNGNVFN